MGDDDSAVEAARRIVSTVAESDAMTVARALLASHSQVERMREAWAELFVLMDAADSALDKDTYDQSLRDEFDAPDDADYSVCAGTVRKCMAVFAAIEKMRNHSTLKQPLILSKEWCLESARREGDAEIGAGSPSHPLRAALSPKEE